MLESVEAGAAARALESSSEASATEPSPIPHWEKKWRRVRSRAAGCWKGSFTGDRFVEVEKDAGDGDPGGVGEDSLLTFGGEELQEGIGLGGVGGSSGGDAEALLDAEGIGGEI